MVSSFNPNSGPVVFFGHGASRTGAPIALLRLLRWLKANTDLPFRIILSHDGPLAADFREVAPTAILTDVSVGRSSLVKGIGHLPILGAWLKRLWHCLVTPRTVGRESSLVYANSVATAQLIQKVVSPGGPLLVHVHELQRAIELTAGPQGMAAIKSLARRYIAMSSPVRQNLIVTHGIDPSLIELIPSFIPIDESMVQKVDQHRREMRECFGIPIDAQVVAGCGATDWRKGVDLFVEQAGLVRARLSKSPVHFVWVGKILEDEFTLSIKRQVIERGLSSAFHFVGEHPRPVELFCGCDVFVLSSREEPMGLVALEAAMVGKPIVCFAGAGGMPDFVKNECGRTVSPMSGGALARAVIEILSSLELRASLGRCAFGKVRQTHHIDLVAPQILRVIKDVAEKDRVRQTLGLSRAHALAN